ECRAFTPDGQSRGAAEETAAFTTTGEAHSGQDLVREALIQMPLKAGRYEIRCGAEDGAHHALGSVFVDAEVPDFVNAPIALSGAALSVTSLAPTAGRAALSAWLPVAPSTARTFDATQDVTAFVRVYRGRASDESAQLLATITNEADAVVDRRTIPITLGNTK